MAGPILGKHLKWWFNGIPFYLATNDFSLDLQVEALDATCYGPGTSKQYEPGLRDASEVSASGFFIEDVAGGEAWDTAIHSALRSAVPKKCAAFCTVSRANWRNVAVGLRRRSRMVSYQIRPAFSHA